MWSNIANLRVAGVVGREVEKKRTLPRDTEEYINYVFCHISFLSSFRMSVYTKV